MSRSSRILFVALLAGGCDEATFEGFDLAPCVASWRVVYSPRQEVIDLPPDLLEWHDGQLYFERLFGLEDGILTVPAGGGEAHPVVTDSIRKFWIDGEQLVYVGYRLPDEGGSTDLKLALFTAPLAGGTPEHVFDLDTSDNTSGLIVDWALDEEALYWLEYLWSSNDFWLWRRARDGSRANEHVSTLVNREGIENEIFLNVLVPAGDRLIAHSDGPLFSTLWSFPKQGAEPTELPTWGGTVEGVASDGSVFVQRDLGTSNGQIGSDTYQAGRLRPGSASVEAFWPTKPRTALPTGAWDDGRGGWFVETWDWAADGAIHSSVWSVDTNGNGERLACDPEILGSVKAGAVAPHGFYAIVRDTSSYWQIVEIARP